VDTATPRLIPLRIPLATLLVCSAAGVVFAQPQLQALLIYDRAAIDGGEIWRLVTGNLVHFSPSHFLYDVVPLFVAGAVIEMRGSRRFAMLCLASAATIGATVYVGSPELSVFGGLSGIVMAAFTCLCLDGLNEGGAWRRLCQVALILLVAKMSIEMTLGWSLESLAESESPSFVPVPSAHIAGAVTALILFAWTSLAGLHEMRATPPSLPSGG
jgi:rhomboid family GlyGly-CTERM serine protease